ncbi:MAG: hypothetical protein BWX80_03589 [Candidatus Hydrogenedentes bacterium ADurb.Bin101]|nr:MAG: hypothetical protein BWX80_03589 [Candidatus Hydrogenedentes bacterium ADurb.Bin101]
MTVSRTIMGFILAFALGVAITGIVSQFRLDAEREAGRKTAQQERLALKTTFDERLSVLSEEIEQLKRALDAARTSAREAERTAAEAADHPFALPEEPEPPMSPEAERREEDAPPDTDGRSRFDDLSPEERETMLERRREFMTGMRERVNSYLEDRMLQSTDPVEQDRMAAFQEYVAYMADLRQQMRDAETDEDREEIGVLMRQAGVEMEGLLREQQNSMLVQLAEEYGITDAQKQAEFVNRMRDLRSDPLFNPPVMPGMGRGRGFDGGGFGAPRGPGFGPREGR